MYFSINLNMLKVFCKIIDCVIHVKLNGNNKFLTMVRKIPNSGFMRMTSPSLKTKVSFFSFLQVKTMLICCAATDSTGSSIRLNSSKQPHDPD